MDVAGLRNCILSTLDPNANVRKQAELDLKYVRDESGLGTFLDLMERVITGRRATGIP